MNRLIKDFREFVKEVRKLNSKFKVGKKFNFKVMAYIHIDVAEETKDGTIFRDVYENPFRVNLKKLEFPYPDVVVAYWKKKRKLDENAIELWVEEKFNLKEWLEKFGKRKGR